MSTPSNNGSEFVYRYSEKYPEGIRVRRATMQDVQGMQVANALVTAGAVKNLFANKCKPLTEVDQEIIETTRALSLDEPLMSIAPNASQEAVLQSATELGEKKPDSESVNPKKHSTESADYLAYKEWVMNTVILSGLLLDDGSW